MSPISDVTYRIQIQTLYLNLNTALEKKMKRAATLPKPTTCGACRGGIYHWGSCWMPARKSASWRKEG